MLDARLTDHRGAFTLDVAVAAPSGSTTVVVGESGAGKTTLLRLLAGLDRTGSGRIVLNGEEYLDTARGVFVPPHRRSVGYVPQDYALFPHLSAAENVAFGLRALGVPRRSARSRAHAALEAVGVADLAELPPSRLSGGQQQRVALARALVLEPRLLLLDEPLAALDLQTRRRVRTELRALLARLGCVTVYVTHSPMEALVFGQTIVVVERGRVSQVGPRDALLRYPRSTFVAELMGTNLFGGRRGGGDADTPRVRTAEGTIAVTASPGEGELLLTVSPREITLFRERPVGSAQNVLFGAVVELVPEPPGGERVRVALDTRPPLVAEVTREAVASLALVQGVGVYATFKATGVTLYA